jgi:phosphatidylglycerol:prolipoprotein diacylglycerol transferase
MSLLEFYQNLPQYIDPIAFSIGSFEVRWYSLMWLVGMGVFYFVLRNNRTHDYNLQNLIIYILVGVLLGGRLGYVIFYNLSYYLQNPLEAFLPFNFSSCSMFHTLCYVGFYGMSYFGALFGAVWAGYLFARKYKIYFWNLADFVAVAIPAGYFFGRLGNFLNGELYGRITNVPWGMYFDSELFLRHPSQLYEAFFEGAVLFLIIILSRNMLRNQMQKYYFPGIFFLIYIFVYAFFRFFLEFFREPDAQMGLFFNQISLGQILALAVILVALVIWQKKKNVIR